MSFENSWVYKMPPDKFDVEFDFSKVLDTGDTLASCTASIFNKDEVDKTASMITDTSVVSPDVYFTLYGGTANETYNIKLVGRTANAMRYTYYINCEVYGNTALNTKLGSSGANSYVTLTEANTYIKNKYGHDSKWDTFSPEGRRRILVEAAKEIDSFSFIGQKYYDSQALEFPRNDHDVITGNCGTPITINSFRNTSLYSSTYGKYPTNYWQYGTCHITSGTPVNDISNISKSNVLNGSITLETNLTATPTTNTQFKIFSPLYQEVKDAQILQALYIVENSNAEALQMYRDLGARSVTIGNVSVDFNEGGSEKVALSSLSRKLLSRFIRKNIKIARA